MLVKMSNLKSNYVSCIRINNVPILPPLITSEKRRELRKIKTQAIHIEKRIFREKELRLIINEYSDLIINSEQPPLEDEPKKTGFKKRYRKTMPKRNKPRLSCDIQSSQYIDNECYVFNSKQSNCRMGLDESSSTDEEVNNREHSRSTKVLVENPIGSPTKNCKYNTFSQSVVAQEELVEQGRLLSPTIIGQEMKKQAATLSTIAFTQEDLIEKIGEKLDELQNRERMKTPPRLLRSNSYTLDAPSPALIQHLKENVSPRKKHHSTSSNLNDTFEINNRTLDFSSCTESELNKISDNSLTERKLKQFIDNNVPNTQTDFLTDLTYTSEPTKKHCQLQEILKNIPEVYSKKIFEMLEKPSGDCSNPLVISTEFDEGLNKFENVSTPNEGRNYTSEYTMYCEDLGEGCGENEESQVNRTWNFDEEREKRIQIEEKAATIITAAAKGFLVRRLLKTTKIQDLIETIKDALVCAMQLHMENVENIDKSDVELHRRLIQQVSAGCYTFYDVFFNTPVEERMAIISADRQKKKEKLLRPSSNVTVSSNRSTPRSRRSINSSFA